ncbi:MAG: hypothetical protein M5U19_21745 [Microthrixaceae bacterium]|nr:hypothetical protein [Microthrixaceae bacterium]
MFSLIGPKRFDVPWKELESLGWIAPAVCTEVRVALGDEQRMAYAMAEPPATPPGRGHVAGEVARARRPARSAP